MAEEKKDKLDQILDKIDLLEKGQQKNAEVIQGVGVKLEQLGSDVKAVAEGHDVIRSEIKQSEERIKTELRQELGGKIDQVEKTLGGKIDRLENKVDVNARAAYGLLTDVRKDVKDVKSKLEEHVRQPAHA